MMTFAYTIARILAIPAAVSLCTHAIIAVRRINARIASRERQSLEDIVDNVLEREERVKMQIAGLRAVCNATTPAEA